MAPVAQLDRVPGYEPGGREFESLRARQKRQRVPIGGPFSFSASREFELCSPKGCVRTEERAARRQAEPQSGDEAAKLPPNLSGRATNSKKGTQSGPLFTIRSTLGQKRTAVRQNATAFWAPERSDDGSKTRESRRRDSSHQPAMPVRTHGVRPEGVTSEARNQYLRAAPPRLRNHVVNIGGSRAGSW
jgi:hypothetical protein